jgi:hypothetical protein
MKRRIKDRYFIKIMILTKKDIFLKQIFKNDEEVDFWMGFSIC